MMLTKISDIKSMGIKGQPPQSRWVPNTYQQLNVLFIESPSISQNVEYLLTHYKNEVLEAAKALAKELVIPKITVFVSRAYGSYADWDVDTVLVDDPKELEAEAFTPDTLVHFGETLLQIHYALLNEGTAKSPKRIITIEGDVAKKGVYEIPFDMTIGEIISTVSEGTTGDAPIGFVQVGGPLGTVLSASQLDQPYDTAALLSNATMFSCAKIDVQTANRCPVKWIGAILLYLSSQSCGQCVYCREGIFQLHRITADATEGKSRSVDQDVIHEIDQSMKALSLCDFGRSASNSIMTVLNDFPEEFEKHMERKQCSTYECKAYTHFHINPDTCVGCGDCIVACEDQAIAGSSQMIHVIDPAKCTSCGKCEAICSSKAITRYGTIKPKGPAEPIPVGSFNSAGGLGGKRRRRRN